MCGCNKGGSAASSNTVYEYRSNDGRITETVSTSSEARQLVRTHKGGSFKPVKKAVA